MSTELILLIAEAADPYDVYNLSLTCKTFHWAVQQTRWKHARLCGCPRYLSRVIGELLKSAEDPKSLVNLERIE